MSVVWWGDFWYSPIRNLAYRPNAKFKIILSDFWIQTYLDEVRYNILKNMNSSQFLEEIISEARQDVTWFISDWSFDWIRNTFWDFSFNEVVFKVVKIIR